LSEQFSVCTMSLGEISIYRAMHSSDAYISRFDIDPRDYKTNFTYGGCLLVWSLLLLSFGIGCVIYKFWGMAAFAGVLLSLVIPSTLKARHTVQSLLVCEDGLLIVDNNDAESGVKISRGAILELTLEYAEHGVELDDNESVSTLNLWDNDLGCRRRHILGIWIAEPCREQLLHSLSAFLEDAHFNVTTTNKLAGTNRVKKNA